MPPAKRPRDDSDSDSDDEVEEEQPTFAELYALQTASKRASLYRQAMRFTEIAVGVIVQTIPVAQAKRLYEAPASSDVVARALKRDHLETTFHVCKEGHDVDMAASLDMIIAMHDQNKKSGGAVVLAWSLSYSKDERRVKEPRLVGMATLSDFASCSQFSTDEEACSRADLDKLRPYVGSRYTYIDSMCSLHTEYPGAGKAMVMAAYKYAMSRKKEGVIALSYSSVEKRTPPSRRVFEGLGFDALIPKANFKIRMYGTWFVKKTTAVDTAGIIESAAQVCTRRGLTPRTRDSLMWRCPA